MATSYWVIMHGDPETPNLYWSGFSAKTRDHTFSRNPELAIRFCRGMDAVRAGVGLTKGVKFKEIIEEEHAG